MIITDSTIISLKSTAVNTCFYLEEIKKIEQHLIWNKNEVICVGIDETIVITDSTIYDVVDIYPKYREGKDSMHTFIQTNFNFNCVIYEEYKAIEGIIWIEFVVTKTGELLNIKVLKGFLKNLDDEAVRVIRIMPNWTPGKINGKIVNVRYVIPIKLNYSLSLIKH